jgi:hypothetical protein
MVMDLEMQRQQERAQESAKVPRQNPGGFGPINQMSAPGANGSNSVTYVNTHTPPKQD